MLTHKGTIEFKTPRLLLRKFMMEDAEPMFNNYANDPEVTKFLPWAPHGSVENTKLLLADWIPQYKNPSYYNWAIELKDLHELIGGISIDDTKEEDRRCEIGYCMAKTYWNQGIMSEVVDAVLNHLFTEIGYNRIQAKHDVNNPASGRVMEKVGMKFEGILRSYYYRMNLGYCDFSVYSILSKKYFAQKEGKNNNLSSHIILQSKNNYKDAADV